MGVRADDQPWPRAGDPAVLAERRRVLALDPTCVQPGHGSAATAHLCAEVARSGGAAGLDELAVIQPDDVCVLAPEPGWPLVGGAVLFPSHWHLADKVGRPLAAVHDRVPGYPAAQVDRFLDRLRPGQAVWRRNVLFHRDGALYAPEPVEGDRWWLRSERQTLRRLAGTGAALFTIATDTVPVDDLEPATRRRLAAWIRAAPPTWAPYAGVDATDLASSVDPR